jgi:capsular exopolysaccharide synthesis family protein
MQEKGSAMNLNSYIAPLRKWWWLLAAAALIAALSSYIISKQQPAVYMTRTTLVVGNVFSTTNPNGGEFYLQQQLASIYADIGNRGPIAEATMKALNLSWLPTFNVRAIINTPLIEIVVTDTNPTRAMVVANELANQLIKNSPTYNSEDPQAQSFLKDRLDIIKKQIDDTNNDMVQLQNQVKESTSARQIADAQTQIQTMQTNLNQLQNTYAALLSNTSSGATNALSVFEKAALPTQPISSNRMMTVLLSAVVGLILSAAGAYGIEYLDDTIKTVDDVKKLLKYPVIGYIGEFPANEDPWKYILKEPRSPISHSFRLLRTNLDLVDPTKRIRTILVTSATSSEGKSTVAANLAIVMAQNDRKVVCVDADFHRPMLHNAIGNDNENGLVNVIMGEKNLHDVQIPWIGSKLKLIPTGGAPENATEMLSSGKMDEILEDLTVEADKVIIDAPPFFLADSSLLCTKVDCVILVLRTGHTRKEAIQAVKDQFEILNPKKVVVVLNRVAVKDYYYNKYYKYYEHKPSNKSSNHKAA